MSALDAHAADRPAQPTPWPRHRLAVASVAVGAALLTGTVALATATEGDAEAAALTGLFGLVLAAVTLLAVVDPRLIVAVPAASLIVVWTVVARSDDPGWALVLILSLAVAAAELAGLSGRLGIVVPRNVGDGGLQVVLHVALAAAATATALLAGRLDGPSGLLATAIAVLGCLALAVVIARQPRAAEHATVTDPHVENRRKLKRDGPPPQTCDSHRPHVENRRRLNRTGCQLPSSQAGLATARRSRTLVATTAVTSSHRSSQRPVRMSAARAASSS